MTQQFTELVPGFWHRQTHPLDDCMFTYIQWSTWEMMKHLKETCDVWSNIEFYSGNPLTSTKLTNKNPQTSIYRNPHLPVAKGVDRYLIYWLALEQQVPHIKRPARSGGNYMLESNHENKHTLLSHLWWPFLGMFTPTCTKIFCSFNSDSTNASSLSTSPGNWFVQIGWRERHRSRWIPCAHEM